jgi:hypothetical protein
MLLHDRTIVDDPPVEEHVAQKLYGNPSPERERSRSEG